MCASFIMHDPATISKVELTTWQQEVRASAVCSDELGRRGDGGRDSSLDLTFDQLANHVLDNQRLLTPPHLKVDLLNINKLARRIFGKRLNNAGDDFSNFYGLTVPACGEIVKKICVNSLKYDSD